MTAVRCIDLCKTYRQGEEDIKALDHVSIDIDQGGFVCLSAPSGGGKTTLLNAIGGLEVQGVAAAERQMRAFEILKEVGLAGLGDRRPADMSGGQQQRVAVARAIVSRPALVLADEPTANLDSKTSDGLMELFRELNDHHNTTFIIATHDKRVMSYAKRLVRMLDGRIVKDIEQDAA
jgi:putative ABC transport system ATP-binding protein